MRRIEWSLDGALRTLVAAERDASDTSAGPMLAGVEQEYRLLGPDGQVDFREHIAQLGLGRKFLDPGDAYAYPRASGAVWTCDSREAEIVLPPIRVSQGFTQELESRQALELEELQRVVQSALPFVAAAEGFSTHISVSVPDRWVVPVAREFAERFTPAFMMPSPRPKSSPKNRPRHGWRRVTWR